MASLGKLITTFVVVIGLCCSNLVESRGVTRSERSDGGSCAPGADTGDPGYHRMQTADGTKPIIKPEELGSEHWNKVGQKELTQSLTALRNLNTGTAKNVILFLGDGMGITTLTAGRILKGQLREGVAGEESSLVFEKFPHVGLAKTYNVDHQVPDSAGTGTAYVTGVKTNSGTLGVTAAVERNNCTASKEKQHQVSSYLEWAIKEKGRSAGIVTTTRITHATPASTYARTANRDWECDTFNDVWDGTAPFDPDCDDIATQLIREEPGKLLQVVLGGGRHCFDGNAPVTLLDRKGSCVRNASSPSLIEEWQDRMSEEGRRFKYVQNKTELDDLNPDENDYVLGLFANNHIPYVYERSSGEAKELFPTLAEMTEKAIKILSKNEKGFALMVEGGRIDHAHHETMFNAAFQEVLEFDDAVQKALDMTDTSETLIIVTADHSHTLSFGGYPLRGAPLHGYGGLDDSKPTRKEYLTMAYANGPNAYNYTDIDERPVPDIEQSKQPNYRPWVPVNMYSESHGAEDVAIYAKGPMAHLFHGLHEQNYIAHVIGYATCTGVNRDHCTGGAAVPNSHSFIVLLVISSVHIVLKRLFC